MTDYTPKVAVNKTKKLREFDRALGRVIASKRVLKNVSQATLSERSGVALSLIGRIEAGTRSVSVAELEAFAEVLRVPAGEMAADALEEYGGLEKLMSEATGTQDDLAMKRAEKKGAHEPSAEEADEQYRRGEAAATVDPEMDTDESGDA